MEVDYLIVGFGLAGMAISKKLEDEKHSFVVLDNASQVSSRVAAGVFNPVILKRFTPVWNADEQLTNLVPFYNQISQKLGGKYLTYFKTLKVLKLVEDQNNWFKSCDHPLLEKYMSPKILDHKIKGVLAFEGLGEVKGTGRVFVKKVLDDYKAYLAQKEQFLEIPFVHNDLVINSNSVTYKHIKAKKIIFAEGYGLTKNPLFNYLPLVGSKGEMLFIKAPELKLTDQLKSSLFVLPMGNSVYWVGATFHRKDKTLQPTAEGKEELLKKLEAIIDVPYTILEQFAGIRPTVRDRRPLVGVHPKYKNVVVLNGLGTRGVMIAPTVSQQLYAYIEQNKPLPKDIDIERFISLYPESV